MCRFPKYVSAKSISCDDCLGSGELPALGSAGGHVVVTHRRCRSCRGRGVAR